MLPAAEAQWKNIGIESACWYSQCRPCNTANHNGNKKHKVLQHWHSLHHQRSPGIGVEWSIHITMMRQMHGLEMLMPCKHDHPAGGLQLSNQRAISWTSQESTARTQSRQHHWQDVQATTMNSATNPVKIEPGVVRLLQLIHLHRIESRRRVMTREGLHHNALITIWSSTHA